MKLGENRTVRVRYQRRQMNDVGFPDFAQPYFFNATSLPQSDLDRVSARYEARAVTPWLANLSLTAHYQRTERLLRNLLPVQFPAPTPVAFFPISVFRLDVLSDTEQRVTTPGVDLQAVFVPASNHVLTTGLTFYRDQQQRFADDLHRRCRWSGRWRSDSAVRRRWCFQRQSSSGRRRSRILCACRTRALRDVAIFAQDEWRVMPNLSLVAGLRGDFYNVTTEATPGYDVASVVAGANPPVDPSTLPDPNGATYTRQALTGDIGLVANAGGRVSPFVRYGRSYRHPNLEELLFAGPGDGGQHRAQRHARAGAGQQLRRRSEVQLPAGLGRRVFLRQSVLELHRPGSDHGRHAAGPLVQTTNYADVRIHGLELSADAPLAFEQGVLTLSASSAFMRGTITKGINPLDGSALDGEPADNITPVKILAAVRFTEPRGRWWAEYGVQDADRRHARDADAADVAVPDRAGPAVARRLHGAAARLGRARSRGAGISSA